MTTKSAEEWAILKGYYVEPDPVKRTGSYFTHTPWEFNGAKTAHKWYPGIQLTESEFDAAIQFVLDITLG